MRKLAIIVALGILIVSACRSSDLPTAVADLPTLTRMPPTGTLVPTQTSTPSPTPGSFPTALGNRAVFSYYFYWYDVISGEHTESLTNVPIDSTTMSWRDVNWHKRQLEDIIYSGIDVILPVFWYDEGSNTWSHPGLEKLAEALEQTRLEGKNPPAVAMFLDTTSSKGKDLRLQTEQEYVYQNIHFFFTTIPRDFWALSENERPILWFYVSYFPAAFDQGFIDYIYARFEEDFGVRPYLVFEKSWDYPTETVNGRQVKNTRAKHLQYDASYSWGGSLAPNASTQIVSIGPGYDDHTVPDRIPPSFTDRKNGDTYRSNFVYATYCGSPWLAIETWNEYHEATEIAETTEYGRQYLDLTREYTKYFKAGSVPEDLQGSYAKANTVSILLGDTNQESGLSLVPNHGDGQHTPVTVGNVAARQTIPHKDGTRGAYFYFFVDDGFYFNSQKNIEVTVTYFDNGTEPIRLQYDSAKCGGSSDGSKIYQSTVLVKRHNTQTWQIASIEISDATLAGNQNFGADFRLATATTPLIVSEVKIRKVP
ncbi:MAG TPA: DUF5010 domain-containing protein [Anaerolineales bacterium]|nr:DUF5010 domain-containing protein [Anaerolineales bacterium]